MEIKKIGKKLDFEVEAQSYWKGYDPKDCMHDCINYIYSRLTEDDVIFWYDNGWEYNPDWPDYRPNKNCYRSSSYANHNGTTWW